MFHGGDVLMCQAATTLYNTLYTKYFQSIQIFISKFNPIHTYEYFYPTLNVSYNQLSVNIDKQS